MAANKPSLGEQPHKTQTTSRNLEPHYQTATFNLRLYGVIKVFDLIVISIPKAILIY